MKITKGDALFIIASFLMCTNLDWDWTNIKSFLSGGVILSWIATRFF